MRFKFFLLFSCGIGLSAEAKVVRYELSLAPLRVNLSGKAEVDFALALNGQIPAPTLTFREGDTAEIKLTNRTEEEASVHWHGLLLSNEMDGVAYITTPPIPPGGSFTYRFPLRQAGTYWYHSHADLQEQRGVYGAIVIHPKEERIRADKEAVLVLSDWTDERPERVLANIKKDGGYYLWKKNSQPSWLGAIQAGRLGNYLEAEWTRMGAMDLSDVGYDAFLANGKPRVQLLEAKKGETVRMRIINAGASSYFYISLAGLPFRVVSADGQDVTAPPVRELLMGMAETYDILFTLPDDKNYELRATAQDVTGFASAFIGKGAEVRAPDMPKPDLYMSHGSHAGHDAHAEHITDSADDARADESGHASGHAKHSAHHGHHSHAAHASHQASSAPVARLEYKHLRAIAPTNFPVRLPRYDLKLRLTGDMERYVWFINDEAIHEDRNIDINAGDVVRITFENATMMHHPMHLHGHFFRVLTEQGGRSPLKHTVDVAPFSNVTIEFLANEPGHWLLHCHNLYHMTTGMARVVRYRNVPVPKIVEHFQHNEHVKHANHDHDEWYFFGRAEAYTNNAELFLRTSKTRWQLESRAEIDEYETRGFKGDLFGRRFLSNYASAFAGGEYFARAARAAAGISYLLPMLIETQALVNTDGRFRFGIEKKFQWTPRFFTSAEAKLRTHGEHDEWKVTLMYSFNWNFAVGIRFSDDGFGGGAMARF